MQGFTNAYDGHAAYFWLALAALWLLLALWLFMASRRAARVESRLDAIFEGVGDDNTARQLADYLATVRRTASEVRRVKEEHDRILAVMPTVIRHVGLVRFSPFHDTGGDQSFALALLDGSGNGVVITGLHSRTDSRLYAKPIEGGGSSYALTPEERAAMAAAQDPRTVSAGS